jgi:low affinity Fe/Cu permease
LPELAFGEQTLWPACKSDFEGSRTRLVFALALGTIVVWAITGHFINYSDTWQLVINTGTTIVTFLMVFLIQNSQNRDSAAIQVKLDELIRVSKAHNSFMGLERLSDEELEDIRAKCMEGATAQLAARAALTDQKRKPSGAGPIYNSGGKAP